MSATLGNLRTALQAAQKRTNDLRLSTAAAKGVMMIQICRVTFVGRKTEVENIAEPMHIDSAIAYLNTMEAV